MPGLIQLLEIKRWQDRGDGESESKWASPPSAHYLQSGLSSEVDRWAPWLAGSMEKVYALTEE